MPIELPVPVAAISQDEFHDIDRVVMGHAFQIHNQFGRLLDEVIYKAELADRCTAQGLEVQREVLIRVKHGRFMKEYFIDLLFCQSAVFEAKAVQELADSHHGQGINYLLLTGTHHGGLVNFRASRVVRKFLSTRLTHEARKHFEIIESGWPQDDAHTRLRDCAVKFCCDVGLGLDLALYREGIATLSGCSRYLVSIVSGSKSIGRQEMPLLQPGIGLVVTSLHKWEDYREHLHRFLASTDLSEIAWINLDLGFVRLESLKRTKP